MLWKEDEGWGINTVKFDSPFDLSIMKEIDHAERIDTIVVKTHIGTAPLTCLSTGCKFGLLVNYYNQLGRNIIANWGSAGGNVFEFLFLTFEPPAHLMEEFCEDLLCLLIGLWSVVFWIIKCDVVAFIKIEEHQQLELFCPLMIVIFSHGF